VRRLLTLITTVLAVSLGTTSAQAITGNFSPDYEHDYVGLVVFYDAAGNPSHRCSGSLLTDRVFLTAGHCVTLDDEGTLASSARVYFEQDVDAVKGYPTSGGVVSTELYSYGYEGLRNLPQSRDVGMLILDRSVTTKYPSLTEYASLAAAGTLDTYGTGIDARVDLSGYGVQNANKNNTVAARERLKAETFIIGGRNPQLKSRFNVQLASNPGGGRGGTCFGDSGGPVLLDDTDVIVAVNSFVLNGNCAGQGFGYRTDQQAVIDFILANAGAEANEITIV
jgi:secreted trypsin-like serine protease